MQVLLVSDLGQKIKINLGNQNLYLGKVLIHQDTKLYPSVRCFVFLGYYEDNFPLFKETRPIFISPPEF